MASIRQHENVSSKAQRAQQVTPPPIFSQRCSWDKMVGACHDPTNTQFWGLLL